MHGIPPIIITGMHRSGTTLLSKIIENNEVFLGKYKEINNESKYFLRINKWILSSIGASWDNPKSFLKLSNEEILLLSNKIDQTLKKYVFSDSFDTKVVKNVHGDSGGVRGAAWLS